MNERITSIMQKCFDISIDQRGREECTADYTNIQMFVQLIVEECLNNIKEWRDAADEHIDKKEYWKGYQHGCDDSVAAFIEYFEVEE